MAKSLSNIYQWLSERRKMDQMSLMWGVGGLLHREILGGNRGSLICTFLLGRRGFSNFTQIRQHLFKYYISILVLNPPPPPKAISNISK